MPPRSNRFRVWRRVALAIGITAWAGMALWHSNKPLPEGLHTQSAWYTVADRDLTFITDVTAADAYGRPVVRQGIFDEVLRVVRSARQFIVLDYFLFNDQHGSLPAGGPAARALSGELRDALIEQRQKYPQLRVLFITDPINETYSNIPSRDLILLRAAGVDVTVTDLDRLRDSNPAYSGLWRLLFAWWGGSGRGPGWLPNPLDEDDAPVSFSAWARLANFKANHRKVVIADDGHGGLVGVVASANPHDASSANSNVAIRVAGPALEPLLRSELAVARFSGWHGSLDMPAAAADAADPDPVTGHPLRVKVLTEGAIRTELLERLDAAGPGDHVDIAMFYIADRTIIEALLQASGRGAAVRLILDPNKDAFGHEKSGIPNRPAASELVSASDGAIRVRWYRTHGEQFHTKLVLIYGPDSVWMTLGSANLTRRNIGDYNLEANVAIEAARGSPIATQALEYFDSLWSNRAGLGIEYTTEFASYSDPAQTRYWLYRLMEGSGLSTF
jgi:phosphatidylserine/phosphatidylglycerophosphate/cardiolipin synthase-like enzyme